MDDSEWFTLAELAQRLGGLVWVEDQLASLLEAWSQCDQHAPAAVAFARASGHHRWHAEVVRSCLPTSPQLLETEMVAAPTKGWQHSMDTLNAIVEADRTAVRVRALHKVLNPWIEREQSALLDLARPVSDAPLIRWLNFVAIDHRHDETAMAELVAQLSSETVRFDDHVVVNDLSLVD